MADDIFCTACNYVTQDANDAHFDYQGHTKLESRDVSESLLGNHQFNIFATGATSDSAALDEIAEVMASQDYESAKQARVQEILRGTGRVAEPSD